MRKYIDNISGKVVHIRHHQSKFVNALNSIGIAKFVEVQPIDWSQPYVANKDDLTPYYGDLIQRTIS